MSIELSCDSCGKRLAQSSVGMISWDSPEWAEIEVRAPRKVRQVEKLGGLVATVVPRYTVCSAECAHKILDRIGKELEDAFKSVASPTTKKSSGQ